MDSLHQPIRLIIITLPIYNTGTSYYSLEHQNGTKHLDHVCHHFILLRRNAHTPRSFKLGTVPLNGGCITLDMYVTSNLKTNITPVIELPGSTLHRNQVLISGNNTKKVHKNLDTSGGGSITFQKHFPLLIRSKANICKANNYFEALNTRN